MINPRKIKSKKRRQKKRTQIHTHTYEPVRTIVDPRNEVEVSANTVIQPSKIREILSILLFHLRQKEAINVLLI